MHGKVGHVSGFGVAECSAVESGEVVADLCIDGFDGVSERFGLYEELGWDDLAVDFPAVGGHGERLEMRYPCPEAPQRFFATRAHFQGEDASLGARHSNPYPKLALFFWV